MKYFVNLIDQSRNEFGRSNGWHQTYWELESKEQAIELYEDIYQNVGKDYEISHDEAAKAFKGELDLKVTAAVFIEKESENDSSDTAFRFSEYKKEAYDSIYEYLKQVIGEDKINHSIK